MVKAIVAGVVAAAAGAVVVARAVAASTADLIDVIARPSWRLNSTFSS